MKCDVVNALACLSIWKELLNDAPVAEWAFMWEEKAGVLGGS